MLEECSELSQISELLLVEFQYALEMLKDDQPLDSESTELIAAAFAAGISQVGLMVQPLQMAAIQAELEQAYVTG